jgi:excinuclease UvrABC helicase subunit UvrB
LGGGWWDVGARLRHNATRALIERRDLVIVTSASAIDGRASFRDAPGPK